MIFLDSNTVLRYLLRDIEEQYEIVQRCIESEYCVVPLEVIAEVAYVFDGVYKIPRDKVVEALRSLSGEVVIPNCDVFLKALEIYNKSPKLDIVDCFMYGYKVERDVEVLTFDKKLNNRLKEENK